MSASIDRSIRQAEKYDRLGELDAARAVIEKEIGRYPNNPRLQVMAERFAASSQSENNDPQRLPSDVFAELEHLMKSRSWIELIQKCAEIIEISPNISNVWGFLGLAQYKAGFPTLAETAYRRAVELDPTSSAALSNLGSHLKKIRKFSEAEATHLKAIEIEAKNPKLFNNIATLYEEQGRFGEARKAFNDALEIDPSYADAEYNLSTINLREGLFEIGWQQRQARWLRSDNEEPYLRTDRPEWDGCKTGHLFVWAEQGVGDEIMFASCFPDLLERCEKLTVSVGTRLLPILKRSLPSEINVIERVPFAPYIGFDVHAPALTAIGHVRTQIDDFSNGAKPWLIADENKVDILRSLLQEHANNRKIVGLSWHTKSQLYGEKRSIPLLDLVRPLSGDLFLVNLQYGDRTEELSQLPIELNRGIATVANVDNWNDIDSYVSLIKACDAVVSIDNSTVHFAGALGKECHVLLPKVAEWRWGEYSSPSSYWYEDVNLHWQDDLDDWTSPLLSVSQSL